MPADNFQTEDVLDATGCCEPTRAVLDNIVSTTIARPINYPATLEEEGHPVDECERPNSARSLPSPIPQVKLSAHASLPLNGNQQSHIQPQTLSAVESSRQANFEPEVHNLTGSPSQLTSSRLRLVKKQRVTEPINTLEEIMKPLEDAERRLFKGFVELESEPALFEYILQENGVRDVKVQELYDVSQLNHKHGNAKVHGLIFLFPYGNDSIENDDKSSCPKHVWFANQVMDNACASVALLNIVMNCPEIELGDRLRCFRQHTIRMKPPYRGLEIGKNERIRSIHNSFMRRMEMLNTNLVVSNEFDKREKASNTRRVRGGQKRNQNNLKARRAQKSQSNRSDDAYHYVAYVPINSDVWRLDGLQKDPVNIGLCGDDWLSVAGDNMVAQIAEDGRSHYNLMAICEDPLRNIRASLAQTLKTINDIENLLCEIQADWEAIINFNLGTRREELMASCLLTEADIEVAESCHGVNIDMSNKDVLLDTRRLLASSQAELEARYMKEFSNTSEGSEMVNRRNNDLTPAIFRALSELSARSILKEIVQEVVNENARRNGTLHRKTTT